MHYVLAIDIGASSGRHIVGWREESGICTEEVYRFPNGITEQDGSLTWDTDALLFHVKAGIDKALEKYPSIQSLSIDTWAVDYVLMNGGSPVLPCYAYRDSRTEAVIGEVHEKMPFPELYRRTGIQYQPFNTIYQLYADKVSGRLDQADGFLMIPGQPGTVIGEYRGIRVMLCATHDTGSAVEGIPMEGCQPYISSGTWSLLGVKTERPVITEAGRLANWSNEGGAGYNRYQKNIMGMWLMNRLRAELCPDRPWDEIMAEAAEKHFDHLVDVNDPVFLAPESMKAAFDSRLPHPPRCIAGYFRCACRSLADGYRRAVEEMEQNTGRRYDRLYIVGGGAKNTYLNRLTEESTGKQVTALPIEATALGNIRIQLKGGTDT